jgi:hypothetical protein
MRLLITIAGSLGRWPRVAVAALACVGWIGVAFAGEPAGKRATRRGAKAPATTPTATESPAADAPSAQPAAPAQTWLSAEDLRLGDFKAPGKPFPFPLLGDEKAREIYVDREGKLYQERKYSGMVPEWGQGGGLRRGRCQVQPQVLQWVGFQNNYDSSRIFIAVEGQACGYVYRPDDRHIVIDLPAVRIDNPNLKRDILTGAFPTPIELVHTEELDGRGTRITIALREPRRYLSAHVGRYVFVDVAR